MMAIGAVFGAWASLAIGFGSVEVAVGVTLGVGAAYLDGLLERMNGDE